MRKNKNKNNNERTSPHRNRWHVPLSSTWVVCNPGHAADLLINSSISSKDFLYFCSVFSGLSDLEQMWLVCPSYGRKGSTLKNIKNGHIFRLWRSKQTARTQTEIWTGSSSLQRAGNHIKVFHMQQNYYCAFKSNVIGNVNETI